MQRIDLHELRTQTPATAAMMDGKASELVDATEARQLLEACVYAFERDYGNSTTLRLQDYLPEGPALWRQAALIELIKVDLELRARGGERLELEDYCRLYPELGTPADLPVDLIYEYYRTAQWTPHPIELEDLRNRFPRQYGALVSLAARERTASLSLTRMKPRGMPAPGECIADFQLLKLLGEGSFAQVFLARQNSLDRQVALKVSANRGSEAQTLAALEHEHIVRVFSETVDSDLGLRLLCMQYVPGTSLDAVIRTLGTPPPTAEYGSSFLQAIDAKSNVPAAFHPSALRHREILSRSDLVKSICFLGVRLAEALAAAHAHDILHRDIKPANVLIDQYGRPYLADFNLSFDPHHLAGTTVGMFGGSLGYMAPEHLDAFNPNDDTPPEAVDHRSDIYSLGVVLFELATGRRPWKEPLEKRRPKSEANPKSEIRNSKVTQDPISKIQNSSPPHPLTPSPCHDPLRHMADERRQKIPTIRDDQPDLSPPLDHVLRRSLHPLPDRRYQSASELAEALDGIRQLHEAAQEMPSAGALVSWILRRPFLSSLVLMFLPHLVGSVVNITYNALLIVSKLQPLQQSAFHQLVLGYNAVVYPIALYIIYRQMMPVYCVWKRFHTGRMIGADEMQHVRRRVLAWPTWVVTLSCLGWLPGGVLFPLGIHWRAGSISPDVLGHFVISFAISGLIALTYSYFAVQFCVVRGLYPRLWSDPRNPYATSRVELSGIGRWIRGFQLLAGAIPLLGAVLMIAVVPSEMSAETSLGFRLLTTSLIAAGVAGFGFSIVVVNHLLQILHALTGKETRS